MGPILEFFLIKSRYREPSGGVKKPPARLPAVFDVQHGGFATGWGPVSWGSLDELFVNLTVSMIPPT